MIIITDLLKSPFDEGAKIATKYIVSHIKSLINCYIVSVNTPSKPVIADSHFQTNKMLLSSCFYRSIRKKKYKNILYIPESSSTLLSIFRARLLKLFTGKEVTILALQPRKYSFLSQKIVKLLSPKNIITLSTATSEYFNKIGINNTPLTLGVDNIKYDEFNFDKKMQLRKKYRIDLAQIVLLHVGHIQKSRNLRWLIDVQQDNPLVCIIVVGSTYKPNDIIVYNELLKAGVRVINNFSPDMEEIYNLANFYVFPVLQNDGAIETPLSVIEAMSCNLPIITTKFGSLPDTFDEDGCFFYISTSEDINCILKTSLPGNCNNREKINLFTWENISKKIIAIVSTIY